MPIGSISELGSNLTKVFALLYHMPLQEHILSCTEERKKIYLDSRQEKIILKLHKVHILTVGAVLNAGCTRSAIARLRFENIKGRLVLSCLSVLQTKTYLP